MAVAEIIVDANGGGTPVTIDSITLDGKTEIPNSAITSRGGTWTATQDCVMACTMQTYGSGAPQIFFNDLCVLMAYNASHEQYARIGYSGSSTSTPNGVGMFVPKGTVIKTRSDVGSYDIRFYA